MREYYITDKTRTDVLGTYKDTATITAAKPLIMLVTESADLAALEEIQFGSSSAITATLEGKMDGTNWVQIKTETFTGFKVWYLHYINRYDLRLTVTTAVGGDVVVPVLFFLDESFIRC